MLLVARSETDYTVSKNTAEILRPELGSAWMEKR